MNKLLADIAVFEYDELSEVSRELIWKHEGYMARYNPYYKKWQVSHIEIGVCEEFKTLDETKDYMMKG